MRERERRITKDTRRDAGPYANAGKKERDPSDTSEMEEKEELEVVRDARGAP